MQSLLSCFVSATNSQENVISTLPDSSHSKMTCSLHCKTGYRNKIKFSCGGWIHFRTRRRTSRPKFQKTTDIFLSCYRRWNYGKSILFSQFPKPSPQVACIEDICVHPDFQNFHVGCDTLIKITRDLDTMDVSEIIAFCRCEDMNLFSDCDFGPDPENSVFMRFPNSKTEIFGQNFDRRSIRVMDTFYSKINLDDLKIKF